MERGKKNRKGHRAFIFFFFLIWANIVKTWAADLKKNK